MPSSECVPPPVHIPGLSVAATLFHHSYTLMKNLISPWRSGLSYCYQRSESCSLHHVGCPVNGKKVTVLRHLHVPLLQKYNSPIYDLLYENEIDWQDNQQPSPNSFYFVSQITHQGALS